jgi:hypothetical protein
LARLVTIHARSMSNYYDLDAPVRAEDFDAGAAARSFAGLVQSINSGVGSQVY